MIKLDNVIFDGEDIVIGKYRLQPTIDDWEIYCNGKYFDNAYTIEEAIEKIKL